MKSVLTLLVGVLIAVLVFSTCTTTPPKKDLSLHEQKPPRESTIAEEELMKKVVRMSMIGNEMTLVFWMPGEMFRMEGFTGSPTNSYQTEMFIEALRPYNYILVMAGKVQENGDMICYTESEIRKNIRIKDNQGHLYKPLAKSEISAEVKNLSDGMSAMMKFGMTQSAPGNLEGEICPFFFQKDGKAIVDANDEGSFSVVLFGHEHKFGLPLSSTPLSSPPTSDADFYLNRLPTILRANTTGP